MSTYKHLADLLKICSVLPALAIMPAMADTAQYTNPAEVESWSNNKYTATDSHRTGGVLKVAKGDTVDEINAGEVKDNSITLTKTDGYNGEVFGQGSVLYNNGTIGKITGTFENNSITNTSATASKATANGGAFALYAGTNIDSIQANFTGNSVTAQYSGGGATSYADGNQISAGGGAMHIQGAFGDSGVTIGTIAGDFTNNSANGDGYANGGAIYIKGGASDRDISDKYAVHIGKIEGDFTGNTATATTGTTKNKKDSTGGALSVKIDADAGQNGDVVIDEIVGNFTDNSVQTNTTNAFGGAIYNEGTIKVTGDFSKNAATATKGKGYGGAIYNVGTMEINGEYAENSATNVGGAVYNVGVLTVKSGSTFTGNKSKTGGAIYNTGTVTVEDNVSLSANQSTLYNKGTMNIGNNVSIIDNDGGAALANYKGTLTIGDNFIVSGGNGSGAALNLTSAKSTIIGKNALFENYTSSGSYGAIYTGMGNNTEFKLGDGAKFINNKTTNTNGKGGALALMANNFELSSGFVFEQNSATNGGAIYYQVSSDNPELSLNDYTFTKNNATNGGALFVKNSVKGDINVNESVFTGNTANTYGGAIVLEGAANDVQGAGSAANLAVVGSVFTGNTANVSGGAILQGSGSTGTITIDGSEFTENEAVAEGGAVVSDSTMLVKNSTFTGNKTTGDMTFDDAVADGDPAYYGNNGGGAIFLYDQSNTTVENSVFSQNESGTYGGAIATRNGASADKSALVLNNSTFSENKAGQWGGALYNSVKTTIGDGMLFENNNAGFGGAIWNDVGGILSFTNTKQINFGGNKATADNGAGGAIYNKGTITDLAHVLFQGNSAFTGGAINNSQGAVIENISATTFANNVVEWSAGGAIRNQGKINSMSGLTFMENKSGNGGALWNGTAGGVVESLTNVTFTGNIAIASNEKAAQQGGAITNAGKINLISQATFTGNQAGIRGGAIANVEPDGESERYIKLQDAEFTGNVAGQQGGAIWNDNGSIIELAGVNTFTGNVANNVANDIHNLGTLNITGGTTVIDGGITGDGVLTVADGALLDIGTTTVQQGTFNLDGTLAVSFINESTFGKLDVDSFNVGDNGKMNLTFGSVGTYDFGAEIAVDKIEYSGSIYDVDVNGSNIVISTKDVSEIAENTNISQDAAITLVGLVNSDNVAVNTASLNAQKALEAGDTEYVERESAKLRAEDKPVAQSVATSVQNQVLSLAANRMSGGLALGRNGGDLADIDYGVWAQGLVNRAKYADKFTGDTSGIAVGVDALIDDKYTVGIGYAYNKTDVDSNTRDTNITSNSLFLYGQYKPNNWYVNAAVNYTMAAYKESATAFGVLFEPKYDVDSFGGQVMTGYDFASGLTPEIGARYLHVSQDTYNNGYGDISAEDTDFLTGVAGLKYAFTIESDARLKFRPEIRAAATYDFMSDAATSTVDIPSAGAYVVTGERLSRFGGEFGIGLSAVYNDLEISLNYDLDLHEHYTSQTGMLKFRFNF